jgi:hypothetical protein
MYIYPDNLKAKATLWLWELRDIALVGAGFLVSVFAMVKLGFVAPVALTAAYAFLTIQVGGSSILDFIKSACNYFFLRQQLYEWRAQCD